MKDRFLTDIRIVEQALRDAGFVPYDQLYGYAMTGNSTYITRRDNARTIAENLDPELLQQYLQT